MVDFEVVELEPTDHIEPGDDMPEFTRPLVSEEFWEDRTLSAVVADGGLTLLVCTPMVGSFASKYVWEELRERDWDERADRIVGLSASTPYAIADFLDENAFPFEIFADPANDVAESLGIAHDLDGMAGLSEPRLAVVALESDLTVADVWVATEWPEFPPYDELEERLGL